MANKGQRKRGETAALSVLDEVLRGRAPFAVARCDGFMLAALAPPGTFTHVIGDLPYDEDTHNGARTLADGAAASFIDFAPLPAFENVIPPLVRCAKRWTICFCAGVMLGDYKRAAEGHRKGGGAWVREGYWHRTNGAPQVSGDRPAAAVEALAIMHAPGGKMRWNRGGAQAWWQASDEPLYEGQRAASERGRHPTKKPLWLMEALIRDFTDPGDVVLDPTMGGGTTGEACIRLGRRFVGCETDPCWLEKARARLVDVAAQQRQMDLFAQSQMPKSATDEARKKPKQLDLSSAIPSTTAGA